MWYANYVLKRCNNAIKFKLLVFGLTKMSFWVLKKVSFDFPLGKRHTVFGKPGQRVKFPNNDGTDEKFVAQPKITAN